MTNTDFAAFIVKKSASMWYQVRAGERNLSDAEAERVSQMLDTSKDLWTKDHGLTDTAVVEERRAAWANFQVRKQVAV